MSYNVRTCTSVHNVCIVIICHCPNRCISFRDSACRCFGYAVSKKRFVYTIDDDCFVAKDPTGAQIDALAQHIKNLTSPSTPFFFNTLYDPYAEVCATCHRLAAHL